MEASLPERLSVVSGEALPALESASLILYQLFDVADSIDLDRARAVLASATEPMRPIVSRGGNIDMPALPIEVALGQVACPLRGQVVTGYLRARIYDLGILSLRIVLHLPATLTWEAGVDLQAEVQTYPPAIGQLFAEKHKALVVALDSAIQRPNATVRTEEYGIFLIERLGEGAAASTLARHPTLLRLALGERRPLSAAAFALATPISYYADDLILLTWTSAVIIEPDPDARSDATFLLEFANVQLLAFRSYDDQVERDLARITPRIAHLRAPRPFWSRTNTRFLHEIHTLIADATDANARVDNALKVTEDVYWNRVYTAALAVLRVEVWRNGIREGLGVLRQSAALLNDEAESLRATLLEALVVVLILIELIVALIGLRH